MTIDPVLRMSEHELLVRQATIHSTAKKIEAFLQSRGLWNEDCKSTPPNGAIHVMLSLDSGVKNSEAFANVVKDLQECGFQVNIEMDGLSVDTPWTEAKFKAFSQASEKLAQRMAPQKPVAPAEAELLKDTKRFLS